MPEIRRLCVYCGSNRGADPAYAAAAEAVGTLLAREGVGLVYGGGSVGLMGVVADAAMAAGGEVVGVIPQDLEDREVGHAGLTEKHVVGSMHERKRRMADLADAFVALPGGLGTLEELAEVLTWTQLGVHEKPACVLDVAGFWRPLLAFLDHAVDAGFLRPEHRESVLRAEAPDEILPRLSAWAPPVGVGKWDERPAR